MNCPYCDKPIADTFDHSTQSEDMNYDYLCWRQWGGECPGELEQEDEPCVNQQ